MSSLRDNRALEDALARSLIVIPSINGAELLDRMLPTIRVPGRMVVVIDQGSTDNTAEVCEKFGVEVVQLGSTQIYTQACNAGLALAKARGRDYVFFSNNDIVFKTDVARELLWEMMNDPYLGIVAPSQLIIDPTGIGGGRLSYRVFWDLPSLTFAHDFSPPPIDAKRIESDFCELTFALAKVAVLDEIGGLDDDYGFYHEDADLAFRLRDAGYSCAYLPRSQIDHYSGSTFGTRNAKREEYLRKSKLTFARKYLGYGVDHTNHKRHDGTSWNVINRNLHPYLKRYGLVDKSRPELIFSHPGTRPYDYLYSVWETTRLPEEWKPSEGTYDLVLGTSAWVTDVLRENGYEKAKYVPLGIETDVFHPWGPSLHLIEKRPKGKTFLWFSRNQYRKGLDVLLEAWGQYFRDNSDCRLILLGTGIIESFDGDASDTWEWNNCVVRELALSGITVVETLTPFDDATVASIYRAVDFTICSSRSEGFGFVVGESLACGVPAIFGDFGATAEFAIPGSLTIEGRLVPADYSDKGFADVGDWWEPNVTSLLNRLLEARDMTSEAYEELSSAGVRLVRGKFTWRTTVMRIRQELSAIQKRKRLFADDDIALPLGRAKDRRRGKERKPRKVRRPTPIARHLAKWGAHASNLSSELTRVVERQGSKKALARFIRRTRIFTLTRLSRGMASLLPTPLPKGVGTLFLGYVEASLGLGESLRGLIYAALGKHLPLAIYPFRVGVEGRVAGSFLPEHYDKSHHYDVNVIEVGVDQVEHVFNNVDRRVLEGSYNILRTYWELSTAPEDWREPLARFDEIWAPTAFVKDSLAGVFDGTISVIPPCVAVDDRLSFPDRSILGLPANAFLFVFTFDYYSYPSRKNPLAVLRAFQRAFPGRGENVGLVIKSTGAPNHYPEIRRAIAETAKADPRIFVVDSTMSRLELLALVRACDCYVSLHRSEGFGLGMVEAMSFGKPVIATDYSGSEDFLSDETGFPVDYTLRPLDPDEYAYAEDAEWAEPSVKHAASLMRYVYEHQEEARARGRKGEEYVKRRYGVEAIGTLLESRLKQIRASLSGVARRGRA